MQIYDWKICRNKQPHRTDHRKSFPFGMRSLVECQIDIDLIYYHFAFVQNLAVTDKKGFVSKIEMSANYRISFNLTYKWAGVFISKLTKPKFLKIKSVSIPVLLIGHI